MSSPEQDIVYGDVHFTMELHPPGDRFINPVLIRDGVWEPAETRLFSVLLSGSSASDDRPNGPGVAYH